MNQTGEFVTLTLSGTPRGQSVSETGVAHDYNQAITQNDAAVNGVIVSGSYTADRDLVKQVRVIDTGYTQGVNLARLQVFDNFDGGGFVAGSAFTISTGAPIRSTGIFSHLFGSSSKLSLHRRLRSIRCNCVCVCVLKPQRHRYTW